MALTTTITVVTTNRQSISPMATTAIVPAHHGPHPHFTVNQFSGKVSVRTIPVRNQPFMRTLTRARALAALEDAFAVR
jgi:hypothetical protein